VASVNKPRPPDTNQWRGGLTTLLTSELWPRWPATSARWIIPTNAASLCMHNIFRKHHRNAAWIAFLTQEHKQMNVFQDVIKRDKDNQLLLTCASYAMNTVVCHQRISHCQCFIQTTSQPVKHFLHTTVRASNYTKQTHIRTSNRRSDHYVSWAL